jgi:hypothetical protein
VTTPKARVRRSAPTMKECCDEQNALKSEICALEKVRGELFKMKGVEMFIIDCEVGAWEEGKCSVSCGGGVLTKTRFVCVGQVIRVKGGLIVAAGPPPGAAAGTRVRAPASPRGWGSKNHTFSGPSSGPETPPDVSGSLCCAFSPNCAGDRGFSIMFLLHTGSGLAGPGCALVPPSWCPNRSCS